MRRLVAPERAAALGACLFARRRRHGSPGRVERGHPAGAQQLGSGWASSFSAWAIRRSRRPAPCTSRSTRHSRSPARRAAIEGAEALADSAYRIHVFDGEVPGTTLGEDLRPGDARHPLDPARRARRPGAQPASRRPRRGAEPRVDRLLLDRRRLWRFRRRVDRRDAPIPGRSTGARGSASRPRRRGATMPAERGVPLLHPAARRHLRARPFGLRQAARRHGAAHRQAGPGVQPHPCRGYRPDHGAGAALRKLAGTFNLTDDEPAPPQDLVTYAAAMHGRRAAARGAVRDRGDDRDGAELLLRQQARLVKRDQGGARHRAALSDLSRGSRRHLRRAHA